MGTSWVNTSQYGLKGQVRNGTGKENRYDRPHDLPFTGSPQSIEMNDLKVISITSVWQKSTRDSVRKAPSLLAYLETGDREEDDNHSLLAKKNESNEFC